MTILTEQQSQQDK